MSEYFIGLDIGTNSVGWAVTDESYRIVKKNGKALWGVRLFDEAKTAAETRGFRTTRRRYERRNQRLKWLEDAFRADMMKVDPGFFERLRESKFLLKDKRSDSGLPMGKQLLFPDRDSCIKYHKKYPTIYHLRKALMESDDAFDVRHVYLAVHHIMKYRGHFLLEDMQMDDGADDAKSGAGTLEDCLNELAAYLQAEREKAFTLADPDAFKTAVCDRSLSASKKETALKKAAGFHKDEKKLGALVKLIAGGKVRLSELFDQEFAQEDDEKISFKEKFDDQQEKLSGLLGEDMQLVLLAKRIYDRGLLEGILNGEECISAAMVNSFERHRKDLDDFKEVLRAKPEAYREMFRLTRNKLNNYCAYTGHGTENYRCRYEAFSKYAIEVIDNLLPELTGERENKAREIKRRLEEGTFLPLQMSTENSVLPCQLHEYELGRILSRASAYLPFLGEMDEEGRTLRQRIMEMFRFRVPYYVGPTYPLRGSKERPKAWVVRTDEKIYPWNFEKVVDLQESAEKFMERLTAKCSRIAEPVLVKDSLLYSRFETLNMINKIRINDHGIKPEVKQRIFDHLVKHGGGKYRNVRDFMLSEGLMQKGDVLEGIDKDFSVKLTGYKVFAGMLAQGREEMVEEIIRGCVIFGEDKKLLESWLKKKFGDALSQKDIEYIISSRKKFMGWGKLSKQFLTEIKHTENGKTTSIIDMLWRTNDNLEQLLSHQYTFAQEVQAYRARKLSEGEEEPTLQMVLRDSYASPGIKRAIHQAIALVSEIEKIMRQDPKRVFVEVTRGEDRVKMRTESRKKQLQALYKKCGGVDEELSKRLDERKEWELRRDKLFLYFMQKGMCLYSGKEIDYDQLDTSYDIDHIYPRKLVKDDSLDNRVLVLSELNKAKSDSVPVPLSIRKNTEVRNLWKELLGQGFISKEKYRRLTRETKLTDEELAGFIARQLVQTSQACVIVADLLRRRYKDDRVVYVKAKNVSAFRKDQRLTPDGRQLQRGSLPNGAEGSREDPLFVKCREVNDLHHAKDAYLNIVVGNVYHMKFTGSPLAFVQSGKEYSMNHVFDYPVARGGECAWIAGEDGSIATVRRMMRKNNVLVTRRAYEATGKLFDVTPVSSEECRKAKAKVALLKGGDDRLDPKVYGGYTSLKAAYFFLVRHMVRKKKVLSIESVPVLDKKKYEANPQAYCEAELGLKEPEILVRKILIGTLFNVDGFKMTLAAKGDESRIVFRNANQLILSPQENAYIRRIAESDKRKDAEDAAHAAGISREKNLELFLALTEKMGNAVFGAEFGDDAKTLRCKQKKFEELTLMQQRTVLKKMVYVMNTKAGDVDLGEIKGMTKVGKIRKNKKFDKVKRFSVIYQSVTGFFEQEIDLLGDFA